MPPGGGRPARDVVEEAVSHEDFWLWVGVVLIAVGMFCLGFIVGNV